MGFSKQQLFVIICALVTGNFILEMTQYRVISPLMSDGFNKVKSFLPIVIQNNFITDSDSTVDERSKCPDVTSGMMRGKWKARPLRYRERTEIETYLETVRTFHTIPKTMQRTDGLCGNVAYGKILFYFRALCDPKGPTPCCFNNKCMDKSTDECRCTECYDLRTRIHAEYSTWEPVDSRCQVKNYTTEDACHLLRGTQLIVAGNSLVRQLYTALLLVLTNNPFDGALLPNLPKAIHDGCTGMYTFSEACRLRILFNGSYCNGTANVSYQSFAKQNLTSLVRIFLHKPKTYMIATMSCLDITCRAMYEQFWLPAINVIKDSKASWPKIIFAPWHKFGLVKLPLIPQLEWQRVKEFNDFVIEKLGHHDIPIFDTFNLTDGVMCQDGTHFGIGLNMMKLQMFFNFFEELKRRRSW